MIEEHARYYCESLETWINVVILQFDGSDAIVRNISGKYVRIPITKLQHRRLINTKEGMYKTR